MTNTGMADVHVRPASPNDLSAVKDLLAESDLPLDGVSESLGSFVVADRGGKIIGVAGLEECGEYALLRSAAVAPEWRGHGISKLLIEQCLDTARSWNAKKITLYSNSQLQTALNLYKKYGFYHIANENSPYVTADVRMELNLSK